MSSLLMDGYPWIPQNFGWTIHMYCKWEVTINFIPPCQNYVTSHQGLCKISGGWGRLRFLFWLKSWYQCFFELCLHRREVYSKFASLLFWNVISISRGRLCPAQERADKGNTVFDRRWWLEKLHLSFFECN